MALLYSVRRAASSSWLVVSLLSVLACDADAQTRALTVAADGSGDFASVQAAVDAAPSNSVERIVIHVKPGTYKERVHIGKDKPNVTLRGEDPATTVLTYDLFASKVVPPATEGVGTSGSYSTDRGR